MSETTSTQPIAEPARILVVDDETAHMHALCDTLNEQGFRTVGFTAGKGALAALRQQKFDVLLTDLMMPEMDGIGLLQAALEIDPQLIGIIMTGEGTLASAVEAMRVGALDYIVKPFRLSVIRRVLERALEVHRLHNENLALEQSLRDHAEELETANRELETATRAKSAFLATMSHEIRTPMNGVLGMLELLSMTSLDAEQRKTVEIVRESGRSLLRIIDDILDFSKMEAGMLEVRPEVSSIKEIVHRVINIYFANASNKGLTLKFSSDPQISPELWTDPVRLQQILNNFVSNAIKFTAKGEIELHATLIDRNEGEDMVRFSVTDTGIGISPQNQTRLFQPFTQASTDTSRHYGGTGLGLSICRRLSEMMGGTIEIDSEVGRGTTMLFTVPMPIANPKDILEMESEQLPAPVNPATGSRPIVPGVEEAVAAGTLVLLVDDHAISSFVMVQQMNALGYAADTAENGLVALNKWRTGRYALIFTDCSMPEMDGYALARKIRAVEAENGRGRTPIIACTASALKGEANECLTAGMDDHVVKPVSLLELRERLERWLPLASKAETGPVKSPPIGR